MTVGVKVCGLTRPEDARLAAELGAWALGLIFVPSSPRALDRRRAEAVRAAIPKGIMAVGVFADAPRSELEKAVKELDLDALQLHGSETPEDCSGFKVPVYKTLSPFGAGDFSIFGAYAVDGFLVETVRRFAGGREELGLDEQERRWRSAGRASAYGKLVLAGRLEADNVGRAVRLAKPDAVDVCGGVESAPGVKDSNKLRAFFKAAVGL